MAVRLHTTRLSVEGAQQYQATMRRAGDAGHDALQRVGRASVPASRGLRVVSAAGLELRNSMHGVAATVPAVGRLAGMMGPVGLALAAAAAGATLLAVKARAAVGEVAAIGDAADRAGVPAELYEQLAAAITNSGQEVAGLEGSLAKLNVRIGEARAGGKAQQETFAALGVTMQELATLPTGEVILQIADALAAIEDPGQRAVLMQKLFEDGGRVLLPVLAQGSEKLREMFGEAEALGQLYGGDVIRNSQAVSAELARQSDIISVQLNKALVDMGPLLTDAAAAWVVVAKGIAQAYAALKDFMTLSDNEALDMVGREIALTKENLQGQRERLFDPSIGPAGKSHAEEQFQGFSDKLEALRAQEREIRGRIAAVAGSQTTEVRLAGVGGEITPPPASGGGGGAGGKGKAAQAERDALTEMVARIRERTEALRFEAETAGVAAEAVERLRLERELEAAAVADGTAQTAAETLTIREAVAAWTEAAVAKSAAAAEADRVAGKLRDDADAARELRDALDEMSRTVGGALGGLITGTNTWRQALGSVLDVVLRIAETQIQKSGALSGLGAGLSSGIGGFFRSVFGGLFADGAAFRQGRVVPFANGTVVTQPTLFPMAGGMTGLMGERPPGEAIMPLVKTASGALGVRAAGAEGGGGVTYAPVYNIDARGAVEGTAAMIERAITAYDRRVAAPSIRDAGWRGRF